MSPKFKSETKEGQKANPLPNSSLTAKDGRETRPSQGRMNQQSPPITAALERRCSKETQEQRARGALLSLAHSPAGTYPRVA
jgi:hypothetical protein